MTTMSTAKQPHVSQEQDGREWSAATLYIQNMTLHYILWPVHTRGLSWVRIDIWCHLVRASRGPGINWSWTFQILLNIVLCCPNALSLIKIGFITLFLNTLSNFMVTFYPFEKIKHTLQLTWSVSMTAVTEQAHILSTFTTHFHNMTGSFSRPPRQNCEWPSMRPLVGGLRSTRHLLCTFPISHIADRGVTTCPALPPGHKKLIQRCELKSFHWHSQQRLCYTFDFFLVCASASPVIWYILPPDCLYVGVRCEFAAEKAGKVIHFHSVWPMVHLSSSHPHNAAGFLIAPPHLIDKHCDFLWL